MATLPRFYVYVLARANGSPFYVGKGQGRRVFRHDWEARNGCECHKCRVIRKVWRHGGEVQRYIVFTSDDEQAALDYEREIIALYGKHTLTNVTDGGVGVPGYAFTPEARAKISAAGKARVATAQARENLSKALKGHPVSEETKAKMRAAARRRAQTPEGRAHLLKAGALARRPEVRQHNAERARARMSTPEARARQSAALSAYFETPEGKQKQSAAQHRRYTDPEQRKQASIAAKAREQRKRDARKLDES